MPSQDAERSDTLYERVLQFMGAFSATQFAIDSVIGMHLARQMPALGPELEKQFLKRIRDDQRISLFIAFAAEVGHTGDLTHFKPIYDRAKQLRDVMGHSMSVVGPVYQAKKTPYVSVTHATSIKRKLFPDPPLPSTFVRMQADCEWLTQHVWRAGYVAAPDTFFDLTGRPAEPSIPASLPIGGEPLL